MPLNALFRVAMVSMWLLPAMSRLLIMVAFVRHMAMPLTVLVLLTLATIPFPLQSLGQFVSARIMVMVYLLC